MMSQSEQFVRRFDFFNATTQSPHTIYIDNRYYKVGLQSMKADIMGFKENIWKIIYNWSNRLILKKGGKKSVIQLFYFWRRYSNLSYTKCNITKFLKQMLWNITKKLKLETWVVLITLERNNYFEKEHLKQVENIIC